MIPNRIRKDKDWGSMHELERQQEPHEGCGQRPRDTLVGAIASGWQMCQGLESRTDWLQPKTRPKLRQTRQISKSNNFGITIKHNGRDYPRK